MPLSLNNNRGSVYSGQMKIVCRGSVLLDEVATSRHFKSLPNYFLITG